MSASTWLIVNLIVWMLLTVARQVCDLIGKLWIPVGFNLLQIICCITGLFGVCQKRLALLIALSISTLFSIAQNVLILLWYTGVFGDRSKPILAAGLPYSFSFFLRYTPGCASHFDLKNSKWVQSPCFIPYYQIEEAQAAIHISLAVITLILSLVVIYQRRRDKNKPKSPPPVQYSQVHGPIKPAPTQKAPRVPQAPSSINDISSGYMNSSYDDVDVRTAAIVETNPKGSEKNLKKKMKKMRPNSMPQPHTDQYSSTDEVAREDFYTTPLPKSALKSKFRKSSEQQPRRATVNEIDKANGVLPRISESRASSGGNLTSLVSFDPKSNTLIRVREHLESEDEEEEHDRYRTVLDQERPIDVDSVYEKIRDKSYAPLSSSRENSTSLAGTRSKNVSQDSVPSIMAPVLLSPMDRSSSDSGVPESSHDWPPPPSRMQPWKTPDPVKTTPEVGYRLFQKPVIEEDDVIEPFTIRGDIMPQPSPGIKLSQHEVPVASPSPGIKLSSAATTTPYGAYRSAFHVQNKDHRVIGHYHATNEFLLTSADEDESNIPVINGNGLLV